MWVAQYEKRLAKREPVTHEGRSRNITLTDDVSASNSFQCNNTDFEIVKGIDIKTTDPKTKIRRKTVELEITQIEKINERESTGG
jgi:hypothetical protein